MSDEQMRSATTRYPVDRYLDKSSKKFEMVNIIDDDIWNPEPALRPEDEIILRKLHEMLQSTADDLKLLSGELVKFHEPGVIYKAAPTPLDEEFNEKVHIEEVVNAKFHGHKIINRPNKITVSNEKNEADFTSKINIPKPKPLKTGVEDGAPVFINRSTVNKNLGVSRIRIMEIKNKNENNPQGEKLNNGKIISSAPAIGYNEFNFTYVEPKIKVSPRKVLQVQDMPSINIRSELKRQNVLQLDIFPETNDKVDDNTVRSNVSVIALRHEIETNKALSKDEIQRQPAEIVKRNSSKTIRKVSKMSTCDSSVSTNNISSDSKVKLVMQKRIITSIKNSPKSSTRSRTKKITLSKKELEQRHRVNLEEWRKKLNSVYGPSTSKKPMKTAKSKRSPKKLVPLNNAEYIPYSKLTVGGVKASDIEKEISDLPNKNEVPLSPILDKILSRENSFHRDSPKNLKDTPKFLTTSDENLLQEVIDIEKSVTDTLLSRNKKQLLKPNHSDVNIENPSSDDVNDDNSEGNESYADDFEDEKTDHSEKSGNKPKSSNKSESENSSNSSIEIERYPMNSKDKNITYTKTSNLSFKDSVDIFEFIHSIDTQDNATQSNVSDKISLKETQTSPRNDNSSSLIQPIHNDLWPSIDPKREVEKMFELEKDFIKKLILDEYGDMLEKNINKPSTSNESAHEDSRKNVTALQKNTQTSPSHVKSVMTSPKRTKTRTTSPFHLTVPVNKNTSPMIFVTNETNRNIDIKSDADDISVNLSSPRFSLRLPQTSREVLSNITFQSRKSSSPSKISFNVDKLNKTYKKTTVSSSSSVDADNSSSELSSLGEIKIKRRLKKKIPTMSECSSSTTLSKYSNDNMQSIRIQPLRSEGEVSLTQIVRTRNSRQSEGETSFGPK